MSQLVERSAHAAEVPSPTVNEPGDWRRAYVLRIAVTDALVLGLAMTSAIVIRFGAESAGRTAGGTTLSYPNLSVILGLGWMLGLQGFGARDRRVVAESSREYVRVVNASMLVFGMLAIVFVFFKIDLSRGYLVLVFSVGLVGLITSRKAWRMWLRRRRVRGDAVTSVALMGTLESTHRIVRRLAADPASGMRVVGVIADDLPGALELEDELMDSVRYFADGECSMSAVVASTGAQAVIVANPSRLGPAALRDMYWTLPEQGVDVLIAPHLVGVSADRLHLTHVSSMPFIQVEEPRYGAAGSWPKVIFDRVGAAALLVLFAPVMLVTALAVKLSSRGPVLYRQERIGREGLPFKMTKFRSMRVGADAELEGLLAQAGGDFGPLAKIQEDPRITPLGRFLRRYSVDELPQLFDVLRGDMSLVGPRPQRDFEVAQYDHAAHRRLRVRPGVTGLWQVSGRSDLSWDEALRLDTYYVENWSLVGDLVILWRTVRAVVCPDGAY